MRHKNLVPTEAEIKANAEKTYQRFQSQNILRRLGIGPKDKYFFVYGFTPDLGKAICWGPMPDGLAEATAAAKGLTEGEVFELDTRDLKKAKQEIKAELLRRGTNPDRAMRRLYSSRDEEGGD